MLKQLVKHYKIVAVLFFGIIYSIFFYLAAESIDGSRPIDDEKPKSKQEVESYETTAILEIENNGSKNTYTKKLLSTNDFEDFLEILREEGNVNYELRAYSNGNRISELNRIKNNETFEWKLFVNDGSTEILDVKNQKITKNVIFKLKFTRI